MENLATGVVPPLWMCIPFAGLLLCIAIFPLVREAWWERNRQYAVIFWCALFLIPFAVQYGAGTMLETVLECIVNDYLTFIVLLFGLYCVAGNIKVEGNLAGSPRVNVMLLAMGTLLASWLGTTGASMLLVRPVIKMNSWRKDRRHIMVFFIFLISNIGGCLTPIGDPPLLMGFSRGVGFFWSMELLPVLLVNMVILLTVFYFIDRFFYRKEMARGAMPGYDPDAPLLRVNGAHNLWFIAMIIAAVILSGVLPVTVLRDVPGIRLFGDVVLEWTSLVEMAMILLAAWLSFRTTDQSLRRQNHFTWSAIREVATLFVGIFITMQPALMILKNAGASLGLEHPFQMFWITGALSSFLDNTPTYLVFLTTAGAMGFGEGISTTLGIVPVKMLMAISCGAVFMGANTYIGNAPNFMVKSIACENGIRMPSFFGYMLWSLCILVPTFIVDTLIFFL